jgi:pimeloyl-ACP methyl ester carboxylesterase
VPVQRIAYRCKIPGRLSVGPDKVASVAEVCRAEFWPRQYPLLPEFLRKGYPVLQEANAEPLVLRQRCASAEAGTRALLLHGLGSSESSWDAFVEHRPPGLELWSAGLPWRAGGTFAVAERNDATWISEAIARIPGGVDVVIAHSFATVQLLTLLADTAAAGLDPRDELGIRAAVLVSPFHRQRPEDFSWAELPHFLDLLRLGAEDGIQARSRKPLAPDLRAEMAERSLEQLGPHWVVRHLHAYLRTPFLPVGLVDLPVHVVVGAEDPIAPPAEGTGLAALLGNASVDRIEGCGHTPMAERPERFSLAVQQFLTTLSAGHPPTAVN